RRRGRAAEPAAVLEGVSVRARGAAGRAFRHAERRAPAAPRGRDREAAARRAHAAGAQPRRPLDAGLAWRPPRRRGAGRRTTRAAGAATRRPHPWNARRARGLLARRRAFPDLRLTDSLIARSFPRSSDEPI